MKKHKHSTSILNGEHDACGIVARFRKRNLGGGGGTYGVLQRTLDSMARLQQRGGSIQTDWGTDGDGAGVLTDIPEYVCKRDLAAAGLNEKLAGSLALGVFFLDQNGPDEAIDQIKNHLVHQELEVLYDRFVPTRPQYLGPAAAAKEPKIVRIGLLIKNPRRATKKLFEARVDIEREMDGVHVVSLSASSLVYKVMGTGKTLQQYYPELHNSQYKTHLAIGHIRMSTNTEPDFRLAHPYGTMVHNGEINTIDRLIERADALGIPLPKNASDTMVVDRILQYLISQTDCTLATAYRMIFPLVDAEIDELNQREKKLQSRLKAPFGNLGQGPAGIIARHGDEALIASDALALRPVWFGETEKEFYATSERGAVNFKSNRRPPRPVAGGEFVQLDLAGPRVLPRSELLDKYERDLENIFPAETRQFEESYKRFPLPDISSPVQERQSEDYRRVLGFNADDIDTINKMSQTGEEPLGSVGYNLAVLPAAGEKPERLLADYCLESVAVITNPALDSERESRPFSLRVRFGDRGSLSQTREGPCWEFPSPLIFAGQIQELFAELNEEGVPLKKVFAGKKSGETQAQALKRIEEKASSADAFTVLHLHDHGVLTDKKGLLDPLLALATIKKGLRQSGDLNKTAVLFESRRLRNLHDLMLAYGLGAELIYPAEIEQLALASAGEEAAANEQMDRLHNCLKALKKGMKKVISTMGIHEIEGYGRIFSSIGLSTEVEELLGLDGYLGSSEAGLTLEQLANEEKERERQFAENSTNKFSTPSPWPAPVRKHLENTASNGADYSAYEEALREHRQQNPTGIRHCLELKKAPSKQNKGEISVAESSAPFYFAAMSYGSTNVIPFTAYAEAGRELEILVVNGEGGEPAHLRSYTGPYRAQQLASGRFGINADLLANTSEIQIKIGQGAKPGEGGLLKGAKVNPHIAQTRHTPPFIDLISPSNNHDFYSIEDLIPTVINELRVLNPEVKVDVKVPAIPNLAPIVTGLGKEGHPDSITIGGFEGSTGAARRHAIRRVGFPAEIALNEAHRALCRSGLRGRLELRVEGGFQSVDDILKMGVLGADRVGFGTLPMIVVGCIYCGQCYTNRCPRGITSPFNSDEEAQKNGVRAFQSRQLTKSINRLVNFFGSMRQHLAHQVGRLGVKRFTDLQGKTELLNPTETAGSGLDLSPLLEPVNHFQPPEENEIIKDRLQTSISVDQGETLRRELKKRRSKANKKIRFVTELKNTDRAVGTGLSGVLARHRRQADNSKNEFKQITVQPGDECIPGNGLAAFNEEGVEVIIKGGAQDGTAKSMSGGRVVVLPGENNMGTHLDGSVGKSAAYGATGGVLVVAGKYADSRFGVRCSGADLIHLGEITVPVADERSLINSRANLKGFAFEYMTSGRGLVLGDPGDDLCTGMTGGVVYVRLNEELGLDQSALQRRLGERVKIAELQAADSTEINELLTLALETVEGQVPHKRDLLEELRQKPEKHFLKVVPEKGPEPEFEFSVDPGEVIEQAY